MMEKGIKQLRGKLIIKAVLHLESGLHIGGSSDFAPIGAVDSPFSRDPFTKQPIIPGSSLKGKMRTLLARSLSESYVLNDVKDDDERIKRMFGSSEKETLSPSRLLFSDCHMTDECFEAMRKMDMDTYIGEVKFENTISRVTSIANPRQIERVPAGAEFDFRVVYNVENMEEMEEDVKLLGDAVKLLQIDYLGGHGSRGYGRVSFRDFSVEAFSLNDESKASLDKEVNKVEELLKGSCV